MLIWFITVIRYVVQTYTRDGYMSTRVREKSHMRWTYDANIKLAYKRARAIGNVVNPGSMQVKGKSKKWYMSIWIPIIILTWILGKPIYVFKEDWKGSGGCRDEVKLARRLGMRIIIG